MSDVKQKVPFGVIGLIVAIGIVYGDIGTSPLYVMQAIVGDTHNASSEYIIGAISCKCLRSRRLFSHFIT